MSHDEPRSKKRDGKLGFLNALAHIFHRQEKIAEPRPQPTQANGLQALGADFEAALAELQEQVEKIRAREGGDTATRAHDTAIDRVAERTARLASIHSRIRREIEQMHDRLGTGTRGGDLDEISEALRELDEICATGRTSHDLLSRARYAVAEKIRLEAGELATQRVRELLGRAQIQWPDPTHYRPGTTEEEIERSRRRRLTETRKVFLAQGYERTAQRAVGIVSGWGADYPDPGTPLWEECVLEGVAAGIRGQLAHAFVEILRANRDALAARVQDLVGQEVVELRNVLQSGGNSITQVNRAVAGALGAIDRVVPEIVWKRLQEEVPLARGEWEV